MRVLLGNASSIPPRLPDLSSILRRISNTEQPVSYTMVCLSYRGYWTSHDRPSEKGINLDSEAALRWIHEKLHANAPQGTPDPIIILWGQSIGCGFATNLAAKTSSCKMIDLPIRALVLETPFVSTRTMLQALYPQKWLPYQYLWPFLRNHLDSWANLGTVAKGVSANKPRVYIIEGGRDELVPPDHGAQLHQRCEEVGLPVERRTVRGALHNEVMVKPLGKDAIAKSILAAVAEREGDGTRLGSGEC